MDLQEMKTRKVATPERRVIQLRGGTVRPLLFIGGVRNDGPDD